MVFTDINFHNKWIVIGVLGSDLATNLSSGTLISTTITLRHSQRDKIGTFE